jgi:hypothetical protein
MTSETVTWLRVATRRVVSLFIEALARAHGWQRLYLVSPWISEFDGAAGMHFDQFMKRLVDDNATVYVVSRPPTEEWHRRALQRFATTGRANIVTVEDLHTKLLWAETDQGTFALIGSANLTQQSLANREIGVLIRGTGGGSRIVRDLAYEAADIYRTPGRKVVSQRQFK